MAGALKETFTVRGVYTDPKGFLVRARKDNGKLVYFFTRRKDFAADQRVTMTFRRISPDGELVGARFSQWEDAKIQEAPQPTDGRRKAIVPDLHKNMSHTLKQFRDRGGKAGKFIILSGKKISITKKKWFEIEMNDGRTRKFVWPSEVADFLIKLREEEETPNG